LVLERLPNGEFAWLKPELEAAIAGANRLDLDLTRTLGWKSQPERRYWMGTHPVITQRGLDVLTRERAMRTLFGRPWPTVAEACAP
jgi:hypothetical protein